MMKVSRSIRKKCNKVILIAFAAAMLAVCISPALAPATYIPPDPTTLANTTGRYWVNYTWQAGSEWQLIAGEAGGGFYGYNRTGSAWQSDGVIVSGLPDAGNYSAPTVFRKDGTWHLIAGGADGGFYGYNRTGSAWQSDGAIVSGLPDVGDNSTPAVFDMGSNVTDSYNISINGTWHNGTTNTSINETVSPGVWVNITVWAWNASGAGTLSAVCVSDNVQAWTKPDSTFGLVGSVPTGTGTYPPGWFETPTPAVTATKTLAVSATAADAQPDERVTPTPVPAKRPAAAKMTAPAAERTAAGAAKKDAPGFTAVFVIAGVLAAVYVMMWRRM